MRSPLLHSPSKDHALDLSRIKKPLVQAESMLEFSVLLLSRHLSLQPRQVLSLLTNDCLYFGHLVVKGKRGSFTELEQLFTELQARLQKVAELCRQTTELEFLLVLLKPCLLSRSKELPMLAITILRQLQPLLETDLYAMLLKPNGIVASWCQATKRHPELLGGMFTQLFVLAGMRYNSLLMTDLRELSNNQAEYFHLMCELLPLVDRAKFVQEDCLTALFSICEAACQKESTTVSYAALDIQYLIYELFSKDLLEGESYLLILLDLIKKAMRKTSFVLRQAAVVQSFWLLEQLASAKNPHSGVLFKRMIFSMLEYHSEHELRHTIVFGLKGVLEKFPNVPVDQLALPLVKQLQVAEGITFILNVFDLELLGCVARHARLSPECAVTLIEYLVSLSLKNVSTAGFLVQTISEMLTRFADEEQLHERFMSQAQVLLQLLKMIIKPSKPTNAVTSKLRIYKKQLAARLLGLFIQLRIPALNQRCGQALAVLYREAEELRGSPDSDLYRLLSVLGVPEVIAKESSVSSSQVARNRALLQTEDSRIDRVHILKKRKETIRQLQQSEQEREQQIKQDIERSKQRFVELSQRKKKQQELLKGTHNLPSRNKSLSLPLVGNPQLSVTLTVGQQSNASGVNNSPLRPFNSVKESYVISRWEPMQLADEEERDEMSMKVYLKKHARFFKDLFQHFSNISQSHAKPLPDTGNQPERPPAMISFVDCIRMLREHYSSRLSKPIINEIILSLNSRSGRIKNPLSGVTDEALQPFLCQFLYALELYDRRTQLMNYLPLGLKLEALLKNIHEADPILRLSEHDQDAQTKQLTKQLGDDPQLQVPTNCKKVEVEEVVIDCRFSEKVRSSSGISNAYLDCYEILSELLKASKIQVSLVEASSAITRQSIVVLKERPFKRIDLVRHKSLLASPVRAETVQNDFIKKVREKQAFLEKVAAQKEEKRRQHLRSLKETLESTRIRRKEELEQKHNEEEEARSARKQRKAELWKSYHEEQKRLLQEHKQLKKEKSQEEKQQKEAEQQQRKSKLRRFINRQNSKLKEELQLSRSKVQEKKELEAKKEAEKKQMKLNNEGKLKEVRKQALQIKDQLTERNLTIRNFLESKQMKFDFEKYLKPLERLFAYYNNKYSEYRIETARQQWLTLKGFTKLISDFELCPRLLPLKEALQLYKSLIKEKENAGEAALNYNETLQLLGRIAMHSCKTLSRMALEKQGGDAAISGSYQNQFEKEEIKGSLLNEDKEEVDNEKLVPMAMQQLLDFMDLTNKLSKLEHSYT